MVPTVGQAAPVTTGSAAQPGGKVDLNTADETALENLPRVGPAMAQRILDWRTKNGRFRSVNDLMNVTGIGQKTFDSLKDLVTVVRGLDLRLALPVALAWAAVAVLVGLPAALPWAAGALWFAAILCFLAARVSRRSLLSGLAFALGVGALLVTVAALHAPARQPQELLADAASGRQVTVTVIAQATVRSGAPFDGTATVFSSGRSTLTTSIPVTVFPQQGDSVNAAIGSTLSVRGTLVTTDPGDQVAFRVFGSDARGGSRRLRGTCPGRMGSAPTSGARRRGCPVTAARCSPGSRSVTRSG